MAAAALRTLIVSARTDGGRISSVRMLPAPLCDHADDSLAMKPAVLDEDVRRVLPANRATRQKNAGHVGLERLGVELGRHRVAMQPDTCTAIEIAVGVIPREQKNGIGRNGLFRAVTLDDHLRGLDLDDTRVEEASHRSFLDAILDVRAYP